MVYFINFLCTLLGNRGKGDTPMILTKAADGSDGLFVLLFSMLPERYQGPICALYICIKNTN